MSIQVRWQILFSPREPCSADWLGRGVYSLSAGARISRDSPCFPRVSPPQTELSQRQHGGGTGALGSLSTGSGNTAVGSSALPNITTGSAKHSHRALRLLTTQPAATTSHRF